MLAQNVGVLGRDHGVVVAAGDKRRLADASQAVELRGLGDPPFDDSVVMGGLGLLAHWEVAVVASSLKPREVLHALATARLGGGEEDTEVLLEAIVVSIGQGRDVYGPPVHVRAAPSGTGGGEYDTADLLGPEEGHLLGDHAADRVAEQVHLVEAERVEKGD